MTFKTAPTKVARAVSQLLQAGILKTPPVWLRPMQRHPPGPSLVRAPSAFDTRGTLKVKRRKAVRPPAIVYPEDALRRRFYKDHPNELSRPRMLMERDGHNRRDWTRLCLDGEVPTGEHVVQYQLYLMSTGLSEQEAYVKATAEFYVVRAREDTERRIAEQEARHFGAVPIKSAIEVGLEKEETALERSREVLKLRNEM
ncbi:mitochondrial ribosomal protein S25-domain-containing protein [Thamnocephalis sphaerospora]|uniref:Small ribosomal subunit protein mS23 n=1 Tax=Thamnocephalis sphaerospora TaxID=78915 RepID=A0A4P9XM27_9FUNG|nr:mitochondrial ribosomal protein S25-domain-containing protein [Thamnocephalis sphaerospora]|eukprot:RKP06953.1 mitochondrial ribosomal protein S25-domain-containing protein [Thamnocephalis sphaerospora]